MAQVFDASQNPPSLKWRQIDTKRIQIIFPEGFETEAQRLASSLTSLLPEVTGAYQKAPRKISVILQNQGTTANGFVQLAPRRSEFFTTPSQEFDFQDWVNSLAVHELRHVVQFDRLTGRLKPPFEGLGLAIFGVTLPPWFYEGDAVMTETNLTNAGRGRQPEFDLRLRTNLLSGRRFSYSKNYLGSLKNPVPDYYTTGYQMVAKMVAENGPGIVDSLLRRIASNPLRPYSFSSALKRYTGLGTQGFYHATMSALERSWASSSLPQAYPALAKRKEGYPVNYYMPVTVGEGKIAAMRQGPGSVSAIVTIDKKGETQQLKQVGIQDVPYFRYEAGVFVWDEFRFDARYHKRSYNVIMLLDEHTKKVTQLTRKSRLFAPALSPGAGSIIAVEVDLSNRVSLVELDLAGKILGRYTAPGGLMLQTPSWHPNQRKIVVTGVSEKGKTLYELDLGTSRFTQLFDFQQQLISRPVYLNDRKIAYKAHYNGIDNLYEYDIDKASFHALTQARFGAYSPSVDRKNDRILFNSYCPDGMDVAEIPIKSGAAVELRPSADRSKSVFDSIPQRNFDVKPYREGANLFYAHSLVPILEDNEIYNGTNYGLKLQSDNKLNTLSAYTGYRFNSALRKSEYIAGFTYSKFLPVFSLEYQNRARLAAQRRVIGSNLVVVPINWRENVLEAKAQIPLVMNEGPNTFNLFTEIGTGYTTRYAVTGSPQGFTSTIRFPMRYRLFFSRSLLRSQRDITPRWGHSLDFEYRNLPFQSGVKGGLFVFKSNFYLPGVAANHSARISFNAQHAAGVYSGVVDIPTVSGYTRIQDRALVTNTLLSDYWFPIAYPDWEIGPLAYVKRIRGGLFADFENPFGSRSFSPRSWGIELTADMNLLRFYLPDFSFGTKLVFTNSSRQSAFLQAGLTYTY